MVQKESDWRAEEKIFGNQSTRLSGGKQFEWGRTTAVTAGTKKTFRLKDSRKVKKKRHDGWERSRRRAKKQTVQIAKEKKLQQQPKSQQEQKNPISTAGRRANQVWHKESHNLNGRSSNGWKIYLNWKQ